MAKLAKFLQGVAGAAGGAGLNVEEVFSTYLYEGTGSTQTITNDIALGDGHDSYILLLDGESDLSPSNASMTDFNSDIGTASTTPWDGATALDFTSGTDTSTLRIDTNIFSGFSTNQDFTIEAYVYFTSQPSVKAIFGVNNRSNGNNIFVAITGYSGGTTVLYDTGDANLESISSYPLNTWIHYAFVHKGGKQYLYVDGDLVGQNTKALTSFTNSYLFIGNESDGTAGQGSGNLFPGYISDVRVSDHARYSSNFTPPTAHEGEGGLVWVKDRSGTKFHILQDSERGAGKSIHSNHTREETGNAGDLIGSFNANGFTVNNTYLATSNESTNGNALDFTSWTFRKAPKFFDVVTYTGTGSAQNISHNLGTTVGSIFVKRTDSAASWAVYHRLMYEGAGATAIMFLNDSYDQQISYTYWNNTEPTDSQFTVGVDALTNASGGTYVAYLFAHNDGDGNFGPTGDQDIIKCGSYTGNGSSAGPEIDLGFEPQWILTKPSNANHDWYIWDTMRGFVSYNGSDTNNLFLHPNESNAESDFDGIALTSTGFSLHGASNAANNDGTNYIYIAIRRGPMAVPEDATDVFAMDFATSSGAWTALSGFPIDFILYSNTTSGSDNYTFSRLNSPNYMRTNLTNAEAGYTVDFDRMDGIKFPTTIGNYSTWINWMWRRAPNFFDLVAYKGNDTNGRSISHNLSAEPSMVWIKARNITKEWFVATDFTSSNYKQGYLHNTNALSTISYSSSVEIASKPTSSAIVLNDLSTVNGTGNDYIAYLFASLDGVSKVGSFTHSGGNTNVDCGFSSGARFVLIKKSSGTSGWFVWDSERGIVAGDDPYLLLNTNAAEFSVDTIDPYSSGFTITDLQGSGTYIFYAIA